MSTIINRQAKCTSFINVKQNVGWEKDEKNFPKNEMKNK